MIISTFSAMFPSQQSPIASQQERSVLRKANQRQPHLRLALIGAAGTDKLHSALAIASHLGDSIAVIDMGVIHPGQGGLEQGSASQERDSFAHETYEQKPCKPNHSHFQHYIRAIQAASDYDVLIIHSLLYDWVAQDDEWKGGDRALRPLQSSNAFSAWRNLTLLDNQLVDVLLNCPCHLIVTMQKEPEIKTDIEKTSSPPLEMVW